MFEEVYVVWMASYRLERRCDWVHGAPLLLLHDLLFGGFYADGETEVGSALNEFISFNQRHQNCHVHIP